MRQGKHLSPVLFALFLDDFDVTFKNFNGIGACTLHNIDDNITLIKLHSVLYADDILMSGETELQQRLTAVYKY